MTDETNDAWMKPSPPNPWRVLGKRLLGCLLLLPLLLITRMLPEALALALLKLPIVLWLLSLLLFARARFWYNPQPLWGRLSLGGRSWVRWTLRVLATLLTIALGLPAFVLIVSVLALPFLVGRGI